MSWTLIHLVRTKPSMNLQSSNPEKGMKVVNGSCGCLPGWVVMLHKSITFPSYREEYL